MKRILFVASMMVMTAGCAGLKKKFPNIEPNQYHPQLEKVKGQEPKGAVKMFGEPISAGWADKASFGETKYYIAYVVGAGESTPMDLMMNGDNLTCRYFFFEHQAAWKHTGSTADAMETSCGHMKRYSYVYDDSKIK